MAVNTYSEIGYVSRSRDYLMHLEGLPSARINDLLVGKNGGRALVIALEQNSVDALSLDQTRPKPGDEYTLTGTGMRIPIGSGIIGRTIDPLGIAIDGKGPLTDKPEPTKNTMCVKTTNVRVELEKAAPGLSRRSIVNNQLLTGVAAIDTLMPIGRGQRELIFGDPRSGKTMFLLDTIVAQKGLNTVCVYAAVGKSELNVKRFALNLEKRGASSYSTVVAALPSDSAPRNIITPATALTIAEYFLNAGKDVLIIIDDMGTHAKYLREIALLSEHVPGRDSYPGDIFYQHAHLVERAGNFIVSNSKTPVSITMLPVIETNIESFTDYIPTNLMSMTDGHLFFSSALQAEGRYPAAQIERSVTRVGKQTQPLLLRSLSDRLHKLLARYNQMKNYGRFGSDLTDETKLLLNQGEILIEMMKQEQGKLIPLTLQILMFSLIFTEGFAGRGSEFVKKNKANILKALAEKQEFNAISKNIAKINLETLLKQLSGNLALIYKVCQQ